MQALVDSPWLHASSPDPLAGEVRSALTGDKAATRRLCTALGPVVLKTLRRLLGSTHPDLDDLLQDSLIAVFDGLPRFKGESSLRHYARRIATLRALETIRNVQTQTRKLEELGEAPDIDVGDTPSEALESKRRQLVLYELLNSLPEAQAETLVLQAVLGHSLEETAEILATPINTIRGRLQTAKQALRAKIRSYPQLLELAERDPHDQ